jgi:hypothetical protein
MEKKVEEKEWKNLPWGHHVHGNRNNHHVEREE